MTTASHDLRQNRVNIAHSGYLKKKSVKLKTIYVESIIFGPEESNFNMKYFQKFSTVKKLRSDPKNDLNSRIRICNDLTSRIRIQKFVP